MILSTRLQGADDLGKHTHRPLINVWVSCHLPKLSLQCLALGWACCKCLDRVNGGMNRKARADTHVMCCRCQCSSPGATGISGLHSRRARGDRHSSRVEAKYPALLSNRDGYLMELTVWTKGSQAS